MDFSIEQVSVNLNGHTVTGWSDDADALSLPSVDLANVVRGADGKKIAVSTGEKGGPVIIKLLANSPSVKFFMNAVLAQKNGAAVTWTGIIRDSLNGTNILLTGGTLSHAPLGQTLGKGEASNMEFTFEFETVDADYLSSTL